MRKLIKQVLFSSISLYVVSYLFPQLKISNIPTLIIAAFVFTIFSWFVKPVLKILFLPVNLITFGLFSWVIQIIVLYLVVLVVPGFVIGEIQIPAFELGPFLFSSYTLSKFWSLFFVSFFMGFANGLLAWIL